MNARLRTRDQHGVTMIEATITVFVLSIVLAAFFMSFMSAQTTSDNVDSRLQHLGEAQKLMRATSKDVRTATSITSGASPFVFAGPRRMKFYGSIDQSSGTPPFGAPYLLELLVDASDPTAPTLKEYTTPANGAGPPPTYPAYSTPPAAASTTKVRFIGTYIFNQPTEPLFTYLDVNGTALPIVPATGQLSDASKLSVRSVRIKLRVKRTKGRPVGATTIETTVRLPNVIYGRAPNS